MSNTSTDYEIKHFSEIDTSRMDAVIIGIHGAAEAGKDTVANFLQVHVATHYEDSFARPLRQAYVSLFGEALGFTYEDVLKADFKRQLNVLTGRTHREELQLLGTEFYREGTGNADIWIHNLYMRNRDCQDFLILSDVRFENEANFVRQNGILLVVKRPGVDPIPQSGHASEAGLTLMPSDYHILNDGTLEELREDVTAFFNEVLLFGELAPKDFDAALENPTSFELYKDSLLELVSLMRVA